MQYDLHEFLASGVYKRRKISMIFLDRSMCWLSASRSILYYIFNSWFRAS